MKVHIVEHENYDDLFEEEYENCFKELGVSVVFPPRNWNWHLHDERIENLAEHGFDIDEICRIIDALVMKNCGTDYTYTPIHGCAQGEFAYVLHPDTDLFDKDFMEYLECLYFNYMSALEITVTDDDGYEDTYWDYVTMYKDLDEYAKEQFPNEEVTIDKLY